MSAETTTELTGAALLREAAKQMRERAEAVSHTGPWQVADLGTHGHEGVLWVETDGAKSGQYATVVEFDNMPGQKASAAHIASWHPAVALAVADWLDWASAWHTVGGMTIQHAEAVARAYLGPA